jgi:hypothetical protein
MPTSEVNGTTLHYERSGQGPAMLFDPTPEASVSSVIAGLWHPAQSVHQVRTMLAPVTAGRSKPWEAM